MFILNFYTFPFSNQEHTIRKFSIHCSNILHLTWIFGEFHSKFFSFVCFFLPILRLFVVLFFFFFYYVLLSYLLIYENVKCFLRFLQTFPTWFFLLIFTLYLICITIAFIVLTWLKYFQYSHLHILGISSQTAQSYFTNIGK